MKAAVYARVSAMPGNAVKDSVPQQAAEGVATVERMGWTPVAEPFIDHSMSAWDGGSKGRGRPKDRPAWNTILELARAGEVEVVVARHVDRLLRNPQARADVRTAGLQVADHSGNIMSDFALGIMAEVATFESDVRSERQLAGEDRRLEAGKPPRGGHRHFGYHGGDPDKCGCGDPDACVRHGRREDEAAVLLEVAERWLAGEPMRALARDLQERGVPTVRGGQWTRTGLRKTLLSPRLAGIRIHRRDDVERAFELKDWDAIFSRELHARLVQASPKRVGRAPERYLLTGLIYCGNCGPEHRLNGKQHGPDRRRYACLKCNRNGISAGPVDDAVWNAALGRSWHADRTHERRIRGRLERAESELREAAARAAEIDVLFSEGKLDHPRWAEMSDRVRSRVRQFEGDVTRLREAAAKATNQWESLTALAGEYRDAPAERRRYILQGAITRIVLAPNEGRAGGRVNLSRLLIEWADGETTRGDELPAVRAS